MCLEELVNQMAERMKNKFSSQATRGYSGWDDHSKIPDAALKNKLLANVRRKDWIDVANLATILKYRQDQRKAHKED